MKKIIISLALLVSLFGIYGIWEYFYHYNENNPHINLSNDETQDIKQSLAYEFTGAYEENIIPSEDIVEIDITAAEGEVELIKGYKTKVWSYNNSIPGPEIRIFKGDTLRINFTNNLPDETTLHFHGIRVPNAMDGVPGVTQDPINPGDSFVYEFTPKDAGTFWFHPHVRSSEQMEKGLYGTIIVEDEISKEYSQDIVWVIDDWLLQRDAQINPNFNTPHDLMHDGRWGNIITVNGKQNTVLEARPGERIRLRLVNSSNARIYNLHFKGSVQKNIIAVDGMNTGEVFSPQGFELAPGNRIDLDITIPQNSTGEVFSISDIFTQNEILLGQIIASGDNIETPRFIFPLNTKIPKWEQAINLPADKEYRLNVQRKSGGGMGMMNLEWTINEKAYPDYDPFILKKGEFNKIRFVNESYRLHPMHLHGQFFKVLTRNGKPVNEPYFRDTVLLHSKETVEIGLVPLDEGKWLNHCHILEHAESGMRTITIVE